jgi:hypothetical protein
MKKKYFGLALFVSAFVMITIEYIIDVMFGDGDGKISNKIFQFLSSSYFNTAFILGVFLSIKMTFPEKLNNFSKMEIKPGLINVYRILYGVIIFSLAIQNKEPLIFLYDSITSERLHTLYNWNSLWLINSVFIIVGVGGRLPYIINFLLLPSMLHGDVGREQLKVLGFWMIFMNLHGKMSLDKFITKKFDFSLLKPNDQIKYWPIWFAVVNLCITVTQAGISKALDPFWLDGTGYYYTFLNHWLKHGTLYDFMLNSKAIMLFLNYATLITEIITLPLILFMPLRRYGVIILFVMYLMLTFIFRIDPIGPSGLLLSFLSLLTLPKYRKSVVEPVLEVAKRTDWNGIIISSLGSLLVIQLILNISLEYRMGRLKYPMINYPFYSSFKTYETTIFDSQFETLEKYFGFDPRYKLNIAWYTVFNFHNFLGRGVYKVVAYTKDGEKDISRVFNENGTTNFNGPGGGILRPRVIQDRLTYIHYTGKKITYNGFEGITKNDVQLLKDIIKHFVSKSKLESQIEEVKLKIKTLRMPSNFEENFNPMSSDWETLYIYNVKKDTFMFAEPTSRLSFTHLSNEFFRNGVITYKP